MDLKILAITLVLIVNQSSHLTSQDEWTGPMLTEEEGRKLWQMLDLEE